MSTIIKKREFIDNGAFFLIFGEQPYPKLFFDEEEGYVYERLEKFPRLIVDTFDGDSYPLDRFYMRFPIEEY